jgi:hypothetical protein
VEGVLAEPQRTNEFDYDPRDLSTWKVWNGSPSFSTVSGIDGTSKTLKWTDSTTDGSDTQVGSNGISIPDDSTGWTVSFYVKKGSLVGSLRPQYQLLDGSTQVSNDPTFDFSSAPREFSADEGYVKIEDAGGWWRVKQTLNNNGSGNTNLRFILHVENTNSPEIIVDGMQFENHHAVATDADGNADATHATMPILSGGATRSEDKLVMPVWWDTSGNTGGYYEAFQQAGNAYYRDDGGHKNAYMGVNDTRGGGTGLTAYDFGIGDRFKDNTAYSSFNSNDGFGSGASNIDDAFNGGEIANLYIVPDEAPSNPSGTVFIVRRLHAWPFELTTGAGSQLESLFNHDFSV